MFETAMYVSYCLQYPLSEIVRLLAFEDDSEAADFCSHHGLAVHDGQVAMDRRAFVQPEQAFGVRRAVRLVENKKTTSVGEVNRFFRSVFSLIYVTLFLFENKYMNAIFLNIFVIFFLLRRSR